MIKLKDGGLCSILPPNLKENIEAQCFCYAVDRQIKKLVQVADCIAIFSEDRWDDKLCNYLAAELRTPFYAEDLGLETKRELIQKSLLWYTKLGTPAVVVEVLCTVFGQFELKQWSDYGGEPYFFRIHTTDILENEEKHNKIVRLVNTVKNQRSWLEGIVVERDLKHNLNFAITNRQLKTNAYYPYQPEDIKINNPLNVGLSSRRAKTSSYAMVTMENTKTNNQIFFTGICKIFKEIQMEVEHV